MWVFALLLILLTSSGCIDAKKTKANTAPLGQVRVNNIQKASFNRLAGPTTEVEKSTRILEMKATMQERLARKEKRDVERRQRQEKKLQEEAAAEEASTKTTKANITKAIATPASTIAKKKLSVLAKGQEQVEEEEQEELSPIAASSGRKKTSSSSSSSLLRLARLVRRAKSS